MMHTVIAMSQPTTIAGLTIFAIVVILSFWAAGSGKGHVQKVNHYTEQRPAVRIDHSKTVIATTDYPRTAGTGASATKEFPPTLVQLSGETEIAGGKSIHCKWKAGKNGNGDFSFTLNARGGNYKILISPRRNSDPRLVQEILTDPTKPIVEFTAPYSAYVTAQPV